MNILLTNDDGYFAPGIIAIYERLKSEGYNVYVVAPETGQSAKSQAITLTEPLRANKHNINGNIFWGITGFPTDCVFMGVLELYKDIKFDLIISGINNGANVGFDINYSGTIGAAREALSYNIPALAVSLFTHDVKADFSLACDYATLVIDKISKEGFRTDCLYNLNIPYTKDIKGLAITNMSGVRYFSGIDKRIDPYGREYYFITGDLLWNYNEGTDAYMLHKDYATLTPLKIDYTDNIEIHRLNKIFEG